MIFVGRFPSGLPINLSIGWPHGLSLYAVTCWRGQGMNANRIPTTEERRPRPPLLSTGSGFEAAAIQSTKTNAAFLVLDVWKVGNV